MNGTLRKQTQLSFLVAAIVLLVAQLFAVTRNDWFKRPAKPIGDGMDYENIAYHLSIGKGFAVDTQDMDWRQPYQSLPGVYEEQLSAPARQLPVTGRPPLVPVVMAAIYRIVGRNETGFASIRLVAAACLALSGALSAAWSFFLVASRIRGGGRDALVPAIAAWGVAMLLAGAHRTLASYANDFLTEPYALLLTQAFFSVVILDALTPWDSERSPQTVRWWPKILAGLLLGGMILCRSIFVFWLPAIAMMLYLGCCRSQTRRWPSVVCVLGIALLCCAPWWARNMAVTQRFMPLGTQGPITLLGGYSDAALEAGGEWQASPEQTLRRDLRSKLQPAANSDLEFEIEVSSRAREQVVRWIGTHVADLPGMFLGRVVTHWNPYAGVSLLWKLSALLGGCALVWFPRPAQVWLIGPLVVSTVLVALLYSVGGRFLVPQYGLLFTLSGIAAGEALRFAMSFRQVGSNG